MKLVLSITGESLASLGAGMFFRIEEMLKNGGDASDKDSFDAIRQRLDSPPVLSPGDFALEAAYVILAGGFRQAVAKKKFAEIARLVKARARVSGDELFALFHNRNKTAAIAAIWNAREKYRDGFYAAGDKVEYLKTLPHIGPVTCNHLARNLGFGNVKYDVWIQRLGIALREAKAGASGETGDGVEGLRAGFPLDPRVKDACDEMFASLESATGCKKGYIDVVLWKACQTGMLAFKA
ncbi:MAG: hypothetical protein LBH41_01265 [Rickettsiales bacterium]|jgi:hypothetical protein|nr:hypothetical protein [Rickettsiales bacterium]